ncbi:amino acid adenylation domain-containing protein [Aliiglaciecola sp.]|nr:amino acid adenylation domain-containing protein [Aliiglaciecola sp.]
MPFLIHQYLEHHGRNQVDAEAAVCLDDTLSYGQLDHKANQLSTVLLTHLVKKGDRVGIYLDKCIDMPVAIYGILKSGAAYVPLDPSAPIQRLSEIINDCGIQVVISGNSKAKKLAQLKSQGHQSLLTIGPDNRFNLDANIDWDHVYTTQPDLSLSPHIIESDLAYIIYTSGSTGKPKGIMHTHHSCLSYSRWAATEYQLNVTDRLGNHSPLHFDISIFDWFAGVVAGCCTIIIPDEYTKFPASYAQLISESHMTVLFTVPFALIQLSLRGAMEQHNMNKLRWVIFGGEPFPIKHLAAIMAQLPNAAFDNMYGPAEVNGCTHFTIKHLEARAQTIPIGPINQISNALIVDENDQAVDVDSIGELLVRTPSMMQGYWGRAELNESAFYYYKPFSGLDNHYAQRYYRTGDLVSCSSNGDMWFIGRKDRQIKIRGYRVELDEIEAQLVSNDLVEEAAVFSVKFDDEPLQIHAKVTLKSACENATKLILVALKQCLPSYAMPAKLTVVEFFPRTTSGKIDRTYLTKLAIEQTVDIVSPKTKP